MKRMTCTGCGEELYDVAYEDGNGVYCWQCEPDTPCDERRVCDRCGQVIDEGFYSEDVCEHVCEECWPAYTAERYPFGFRLTPDDEYEDEDDYYQAYDNESHSWQALGWYWTQWY